MFETSTPLDSSDLLTVNAQAATELLNWINPSNVNSVNEHGDPAMLSALKQQRIRHPKLLIPIINKFLTLGGNYLAVNKQGMSAFRYANEQRLTYVVELFHSAPMMYELMKTNTCYFLRKIKKNQINIGDIIDGIIRDMDKLCADLQSAPIAIGFKDLIIKGSIVKMVLEKLLPLPLSKENEIILYHMFYEGSDDIFVDLANTHFFEPNFERLLDHCIENNFSEVQQYVDMQQLSELYNSIDENLVKLRDLTKTFTQHAPRWLPFNEQPSAALNIAPYRLFNDISSDEYYEIITLQKGEEEPQSTSGMGPCVTMFAWLKEDINSKEDSSASTQIECLHVSSISAGAPICNEGTSSYQKEVYYFGGNIDSLECALDAITCDDEKHSEVTIMDVRCCITATRSSSEAGVFVDEVGKLHFIYRRKPEYFKPKNELVSYSCKAKADEQLLSPLPSNKSPLS